MNEQNKKLLNDFTDYLKLKDFKPRGIEEKVRSLKYYLLYAEDNNIDIYHTGIKEAESYIEYLRLLTKPEGKTRYNPKTINLHISYLRLFHIYLISKGKTLKNAFNDIDKMKETYNMPKNILTIEEMKKMLEGIEVNNMSDFKFKVIVEVLYSTGARINEIENLTVKDINLNNGFIKIYDDKERKDRNAVLTEYSVELLKLYMKHMNNENEEYIFMQGKKRTLNKWMNDRLKKLCGGLKLPHITCHGIRHITATHLFKKGADIREVQEYLGHKRIKNTEIYTHIFPDDLKKIVEENHPREKKLRNENEA